MIQYRYNMIQYDTVSIDEHPLIHPLNLPMDDMCWVPTTMNTKHQGLQIAGQAAVPCQEREQQQQQQQQQQQKHQHQHQQQQQQQQQQHVQCVIFMTNKQVVSFAM